MAYVRTVISCLPASGSWVFTRALSISVLLVMFSAEGLCQENNTDRTPNEDARLIEVTADQYPPYVSSSSPHNGVLAELITQALSTVGYRFKINFQNWNRAYKMAEDGDVDGILGIWHTEARAQVLAYSQPLLPVEIRFVHFKSLMFHFDSLKDLEPYRVGHVLGYAYPTSFSQGNLNRVHVYDVAELIKLLVNHRLDIVLMDKVVALQQLKNSFPELISEIQFQDPPYAGNHLYLALSKKRPNMEVKLRVVNQGLENIRLNGEFDRILREHGVGTPAESLSQ